jgi:CMP-N-acetylneuraminic acid synthetase|tara:strand:+ start:664 stop:1383 length:720 start_codon:yes stop_codon:yes gene_type:complete
VYKKRRVLAITLARGGSKTVPNKNINFLKGKPLIYYTIKEALKSKFIDRYVVSTDSKKIMQISKKYGAEVPFLRPKYLSTDRASSVDALKHCVKWIESKEKQKYDIVIELMCTNPLKKSKDFDLILKKLINTKSDSVIAVHRLFDNHPSRIKKIINDKIVNFAVKEKSESRRQDLKPYAYVRSGSVYALKRNYLMNKSRRYGSKNSRPYILPPNKVINIDEEIDFLTAELMLKKNEKKL